MKVRRLTKSGLVAFEEHINMLRMGVIANSPLFLLDSPEHSEALDSDIDVDSPDFETRFEMGTYLVKKFEDHDLQKYLGDTGFWSWFALLWFDQLCPAKPDGSRKPSMPYNYILSKKFNHRPRHAIFSTWQLVHLYGEDSKFLLCNELKTRGELAEQLLSRQGILTCRGVMELASELYLDLDTGRFKRGAAARKSAGCVSRFVGWLQQIELTFDIFSSEKEDLKELLPDEFGRFLPDNM